MACYFPEVQEENHVDWLNKMTSLYYIYTSIFGHDVQEIPDQLMHRKTGFPQQTLRSGVANSAPNGWF